MNRMYAQWRWVTAGVLAASLLAAGIAMKARGEDNKPAPKKEKADKKPAPGPFADIDELMKQLGPGVDDATRKEMRRRMEETRKRLEQAMKQMQNRRGFGIGLAPLPVMPILPGFGGLGELALPNRPAVLEDSRLGAQLQKPSKTLEDQLDLPKDQGMVLEEVGANSAAAKAGLKAHDILLELNGKPVPSDREGFDKLLSSVKAKTPVDAVVMRKGKKETVKGLVLDEARAAAPAEQPGLPAFPNLGGRMLLPGVGGPGAAGGLDGSTSISRFINAFTATNRTANVRITVKGKVEGGKVQLGEVTIKSGDQTKTYDSLDKVPAEHRERVKKLVQLSTRGGLRLNRPFGEDF